jgi:hypothetical protein
MSLFGWMTGVRLPDRNFLLLIANFPASSHVRFARRRWSTATSPCSHVRSLNNNNNNNNYQSTLSESLSFRVVLRLRQSLSCSASSSFAAIQHCKSARVVVVDVNVVDGNDDDDECQRVDNAVVVVVSNGRAFM